MDTNEHKLKTPNWRLLIRDRLAGLGLEGQQLTQIADEMGAHVEDRYRDLLRQGTPEPEARQLAFEELPAHIPVIEKSKRGHMTAILPDLRIALRALWSKPAFSITVLALLALGIGGNVAIFGIYNGLFLRALPVAEADRLLDLDEAAPQWNLKSAAVSNPDYDAWQKGNSTFEAMSFSAAREFNLSGLDQSQRIKAAAVGSEMLSVLRLKPLVGRGFLEEEDRPGGAKVAMLGFDLWQRQFNGDPNVAGKIVKLDEEPYTIVGVLPREAVFPADAELWIPLAANRTQHTGWYLHGIGRLKPGVSIEQARADLMRVHKSGKRQATEITHPTAVLLRDRIVGDLRPASRLLLGGVALVLLIACVNVGALMLVRAASRSREMSIRAAIGAARGRILQQLLTENLVLAAIGGVLGVVLGYVALQAMTASLPAQVPRWITFGIDVRFAMFAVAVTGVTLLLFGLAPAIQTSRADTRACLQDASMKTSISRARRLTLNGLVVVEIALAVALLAGAGLLVQAFRKVMNIDPGFRAEGVLTFRVSPPQVKYSKPEQRVAFFNSLMEKLRAMPGVQHVGAASAPPLGGHSGRFFEGEGQAAGRQGEQDSVVLMVIASQGYFEAIGMTLREGRTFEERDEQAGARAVMINESFAKRTWPGQNAVGRRIRMQTKGAPWLDVIGVMRDERHYGLDQEPRPTVFYAMGRSSFGSLALVVRGAMDPNHLVGLAREALRQVDPATPMYGVITMSEKIEQSLWTRRAYSWMFGVFACVALLLAAAGIYGVISYAVSQRTQEIGIRMALGAQPGQVLGEVLRGGMVLVGLGLAMGVAGAIAGARLLDSMLFGVSPRDALVYALVAIGVGAVGLLANLAPARRASSIDPIRALRFE